MNNNLAAREALKLFRVGHVGEVLLDELVASGHQRGAAEGVGEATNPEDVSGRKPILEVFSASQLNPRQL